MTNVIEGDTHRQPRRTGTGMMLGRNLHHAQPFDLTDATYCKATDCLDANRTGAEVSE